MVFAFAGDSIANYSGEFFVDSAVTVIYNIDVKGMIKGFNFGAIKNYPATQKNKITIKDNIVKVELNSADTLQLRKVPGIGAKLAARTSNYRLALGGFYDLEQIKEVYNMPEISIEQLEKYFYIDKTKLSKLNLNTDSIIHLSRHPYLNWNQAKSIVNYRKVHGDYTNINQILMIKLIPDALFHKIAPYLTTSGLIDESP